MSEEQWFQLAIVSVAPLATLAVVLVGFLYNNARLTDLRHDMTSRMSTLRDEMLSRMSSLDASVNQRVGDLASRISSLDASVNQRLDDTRDVLRAEMARNHSEMLHRFADLDGRLTRIETRLNLG